MKIAAQVYSVRQEAEADFRGTMEQIKKMGYEGVELAGLYGMEPEQIARCLKEIGLEPVSAHVPLEALAENVEATVQAYKQIGCSYIAIPYMAQERHKGGALYEETLEFIKKVSDCCKEQGITLLYHNHSFEFEKTPQGEYLLDALYKDTDSQTLGVELDTCWARVAGVDPAAYLMQYEGRCPVVHMKDFCRQDEQVLLVALGDGEQDLEELTGKAGLCGAKWLVVEQDDHPFGTPMENMEKSISYLLEMQA